MEHCSIYYCRLGYFSLWYIINKINKTSYCPVITVKSRIRQHRRKLQPSWHFLNKGYVCTIDYTAENNFTVLTGITQQRWWWKSENENIKRTPATIFLTNSQPIKYWIIWDQRAKFHPWPQSSLQLTDLHQKLIWLTNLCHKKEGITDIFKCSILIFLFF